MAALGDFLAGVGGAPVNRQGLEAFVANSQAQNSLRSAQTEQALLNAQNTRDELASKDRIESTLGDYLSSVGDPHSSEHAAFVSNMYRAGGGKYKELEEGIKSMLGNVNTQTVMDPNADPNARAAADQALNPGANPYQAVEGQLVPRFQQNGQTQQPTIFQTAGSQAVQAKDKGQAAEANAKASQSAGPTDPEAINFGSYMLYKTGKMPALGMGAGPARSAILSGAAQLANREANGEQISNPGYDTAISNGQDYTAGNRALGSFAAGPLGNQTRALNNGVGHLRLFEDSFNALNNGDMQSLNKLSNIWKREFGSPAPTTLHAMATIVGPELTKILAGSNAGTGEERQQFAETAGSLANSPEQMQGAIGALRGMLGRQATDLALQYHGATGRSDFAKRYLQPDVAADLDLSSDATQAQHVSNQGAAPANVQLPSLADIQAEMARRKQIRGGR